jgi:membrane protease YdiL (CAAX protease family)
MQVPSRMERAEEKSGEAEVYRRQETGSAPRFGGTMGKTRSVCKNHRQSVGLLLLGGLLLLRIPLLGGVRYFTWPDYLPWLWDVYGIGTYTLTAALVYLERDRLPDFHISGVSLGILTLGPLVEPIVHWVLGGPLFGSPLRWSWQMVFHWPQIAVGIILLVVLLRAREPPFKMKMCADILPGLVVAVAVGTAYGLISGYLLQFQGSPQPSSWIRHRVSLPVVVALLTTELAQPAINEEPLFRGFLWGYLRRTGWAEAWIWVFQASMFWLAHIYYLGRAPISFWVTIPLAGLILGLLAWRFRSITTGMIAHCLMNTIGILMTHYSR